MNLENKTILEVKGYKSISVEEFYNSKPDDCIRLFHYEGRWCVQYFYKKEDNAVVIL